MNPNLIDQLRTFVTVVEEGSFTGAARRLNRAVSSVSYAVAQIERHCGFPLLERVTRQPELTRRGRAVFAEASFLVESARRLTAHMKALEKGEETRIRIAVDVLFPLDHLHAALQRFDAARPRARVQLFTSSLNTLWETLRSGDVDFALTFLANVPADMTARSFRNVTMWPVAAATHPLARMAQPIPIEAFQSERQIYFIGDPGVDVERLGRVFGPDVWTSNDLEHIRMLVTGGFGWCFTNEAFFAREEASGAVKRLRSADNRLHPVRALGAAWSIDRAPGPLGGQIVDFLAGALGEAD
ncbi:LysR family transcriptional regulator [Aureimonas phyllosphaerae]|uniref:DNA-binding transcriptional LysR family regulator n=1 Tax=Aureimonas phyllosphaerae TaxID=1166078 RepID=A0A7W6BRU2_9HYPH|nr:LysR family transcriptional regulator [Aureimonas phyllosphaerae]MBB3936904.1 DNA-binding transcriptional LysR family regulator [Aureimonas phyllosphaerae]MBB3960981.1 DNA-binding transcriptional LysR family regulator [Aureimonas phyllosphaerae]SFF27239.1 transcriptional regulator, LysR family [Aureimonas phyllosphaerae]